MGQHNYFLECIGHKWVEIIFGFGTFFGVGMGTLGL